MMRKTFNLIWFLSVVIFSSVSTASDLSSPPVIILLHFKGAQPDVEKVRSLLNDQLKTAGLEIELLTVELSEFSKSDNEQLKSTKKLMVENASFAAVSYQCIENQCKIDVFQADASAKTSILYDYSKHPDLAAFSTAATLREIILGPMLVELKRISEESRNPRTYEKTLVSLIESPFEDRLQEETSQTKFPTWLEFTGSYQGDCPFPIGHLLHGLSLGIGFQPFHLLGIELTAGWLGIERSSLEGANLVLHRFVGSLITRLVFSVGYGRISIGAIGRLDAVFAKTDNPSSFEDMTQNYLEAYVGGITVWHLPLSKQLDFTMGAGLTASVLSRTVKVTTLSGNHETASPASALRMIWTIGFTFLPSRLVSEK